MAHVHSYSVGPDAEGNYWLESHGQRIGGPYKSAGEADDMSRQVSQEMGENPVDFYIDWLKDNHPETGGWSDALGLKQYRSELFGDMEFEMEMLTPRTRPGAWMEPDPLLKSGVDAGVAEYIDLGLNDRVFWPLHGVQTPNDPNAFLMSDAEFAAAAIRASPEALYNKLSTGGGLRNDQGFEDWVENTGDEISNSDIVALFHSHVESNPNDTWRHEFRHRGYDRTVGPELQLTKHEEETLMRNYDLEYGGEQSRKQANKWLAKYGEVAPLVEDVNAMIQPAPNEGFAAKMLSLFN